MKVIESGMQFVKWECPDCGYNNDLEFIDSPPRYIHCAICNHESGEITWKKVDHEARIKQKLNSNNSRGNNNA